MPKANIDQLKRGIEVEMEHTKGIKDKTKKLVFALKIAIDHLKEDPKYYDKHKAAGLEEVEEYNEGEFCAECLKEYIINHKDVLTEAEYQGRKVQLGKPMAGDVKKFKVYVKNAKGKVVKVNFGQKGVKIKKNNPKRRKSFRARHNCDNPGPRWKARYWSCRKW
jgi:2,3-bisphosphoglycerate-independent phosphoglycerate mutase